MKSVDEFKEELYAKYGKRLIIPSDAVYLGNKKPIRVICPIHGDRWMRPNNLLSGASCKECGYELVSEKNRDTVDVFLEKARKVHGDKYEYPSIYDEYGNVEKIHIKCNKCHNIFEQRPNLHIYGNGCPFCNPFPKKYDIDSLRSSIERSHPNIELVHWGGGDNDSEIIVKCKVHGDEWSTTPHRLAQQKFACKKCYIEAKNKMIMERQREKFDKFIHEFYAPFYDVSQVKYIGNHEKVKLICPIHGEFSLRPDKMISRLDGCPYCKESHLEKSIRLVLDKNSIEYERQKTFEWLKSKGNMFLDFYIPQYNIAIECQGEQHVMDRDGSIFQRNESFEDIAHRDKLKHELCLEHEIRIIYVFNEKHHKKALDESFASIYDESLSIENIIEDNSILIDVIHEKSEA